MHVVVMGGGKMGEALVAGLVAGGWSPGDIHVAEVRPSRRDELAGRFPGLSVGEGPVRAPGAVVAVKPHDVAAACGALREVGVGRVLSIAAGVPTSRIEAVLGREIPVVRAMPNMPALIGAGVAALAPGTHAGEADLAWAEAILKAVGTVVRVPEALLDAVTGLSGSGPAYVFVVAEALVEGGVAAGLPRDVCITLVVQTLLGSARMLAETGERAEALRAAVTSPGGTTAAALRRLEAAAVRSAFVEAVLAATERARELGRDAP